MIWYVLVTASQKERLPMQSAMGNWIMSMTSKRARKRQVHVEDAVRWLAIFWTMFNALEQPLTKSSRYAHVQRPTKRSCLKQSSRTRKIHKKRSCFALAGQRWMDVQPAVRQFNTIWVYTA